MIEVHQQDFLGGRMKVMASGMAQELGYNKYSQILMDNNNFHNNTGCIILVGYYTSYQVVELKIGVSYPKMSTNIYRKPMVSLIVGCFFFV